MNVLTLGAAVILFSFSGVAAAMADSPEQVATAYFQAMEQNDLDAAGDLFAEDSMVFETGGLEGSWATYREHHLGPEIDAIESFVTSVGEMTGESSEDGSMAFVAVPIEYKIVLKDERVIDSRGTVSFVFVRVDDDYRIRHLHWSSRRKK